MTVAEHEWWYVRVHPGRLGLMDRATMLVVPWLREQADREGADRWFFMRYVDMSGPHLRLRLRCSPDGVDRVHARLPELRDLVAALPADVPARRLVTSSYLGAEAGPRIVRTGLYGPELRKYGGAAGVEAAEELFTRCSRWYLDQTVGRLDPLTDRLALALRFLRAVVPAARPDHQEQFWAAHRAQWAWHLRAAAARGLPVRDLVERIRAAAEVDTTGPAPAVLDAHVRDVAAATAAVPADGRGHRLLHLVHMELNRWGYLPAEECALGLAAQS